MKKINNIEVSIDLCSIKSVDYESAFNYCFYVENLRKLLQPEVGTMHIPMMIMLQKCYWL